MRAPTVSLPLRGHVAQESASLPGTAPVVVPGSRITETSTVSLTHRFCFCRAASGDREGRGVGIR